MKRIGVFSFFDKDGIIDDYVIYYLRSIRNHLNKVILVSNGCIKESENTKIEGLVDEIVIRENEGFDAGAYKHVIESKYREIMEYDELLLFNDTVFGPLYSFDEIFNNPKISACDMWGITRHERATAWGKKVPACIQSYFICIRNDLLHSKEFLQFWNAQSGKEKKLDDVVLNFEFAFTNYFETKGYKWVTIVDYSELDSVDDACNYSPTYYANYELIRYKRYPFIKRKNFSFHDGYRICNGEDIRKCIDYIEKNNLYDMNMIWKNVLRLYNVQDIYAACHFAYIIEDNNEKNNKTATIVAIIQNDIVAEYFSEKILGASEEFEKIIVYNCTGDALKFDIPADKLEITENYECLIDSIKDIKTELVCVVTDTQHSETDKIQSKSHSYIDIDNMIYSLNMIKGIKTLFSENKNLGLLYAPDTYMGKYYMSSGGMWHDEYEGVKSLYDDLELNTPINKNIRKISNSLSFWARTESINAVINSISASNSLKDAVYLLPYAAAQKSYYSGIALSNYGAAIEYVNYRDIISKINEPYISENVMLDMPLGYLRGLKQIIDFCESYNRIYIYGAGDFGKKIYELISSMGVNVEAFVVSSLNNNPNTYCGKKVIEKDTLSGNDKDGVIIAMSSEKQDVVKQSLRSIGVKNIYRI